MGGHGAMEVAKTVIEVADVAWKAMECVDHFHHHHNHDEQPPKGAAITDEELDALRAENRRLRDSLEQNLKLLGNLTESLTLVNDCPPDLYQRLVAAVNSESYLKRIKALQQRSMDCNHFPFKVATGNDLEEAEILINVDQKDPSWWVWVTEDMIPGKVEERSGIDNDSYVVVSEEHVVEGVADFMAKSIMANPKSANLTPEELQKIVAKSMAGVSKLEKVLGIWHAGKLFYAFSTWGLALAGLYRTRTVIKLAAMGLHTTSKVLMRAM